MPPLQLNAGHWPSIATADSLVETAVHQIWKLNAHFFGSGKVEPAEACAGVREIAAEA